MNTPRGIYVRPDLLEKYGGNNADAMKELLVQTAEHKGLTVYDDSSGGLIKLCLVTQYGWHVADLVFGEEGPRHMNYRVSFDVGLGQRNTFKRYMAAVESGTIINEESAGEDRVKHRGMRRILSRLPIPGLR
jgi:hypothetical protein